jgi:hypothetical protein
VMQEERLIADGKRLPRPLRRHAPSEDELAAHSVMLDKLKDPLWRRAV